MEDDETIDGGFPENRAVPAGCDTRGSIAWTSIDSFFAPKQALPARPLSFHELATVPAAAAFPNLQL
jgi:hypothetical protein